MGSHARMLAALCAALTLTMAMAAAAVAATSFVRVEGAGSWATSTSALGDRVAVEHPAAPLTVTADGQQFTCAADSPASLLNQAVGASSWAAHAVERTSAPGTYDLDLTAIKGIAEQPLATPAWKWVAFLGSRWTTDICDSHVADGFEVLFYPLCDSATPVRQDACYSSGPLLMRLAGEGTWFETKVLAVSSGDAPASVEVVESKVTDRSGFAQAGVPAANATVVNDENYSTTTAGTPEEPRNGFGVVRFSLLGDHWIRANWSGHPPVRLKVCSTDNQDGFCGTSKPDVNTTPPPDPPSQCLTNGADGNCGTVDTTGPPTHVTNIKQSQVFGKKSGPTKVTGTIDIDRSGLKDVQMRLTRVSTARVIVKPKPKKKAKKKTAKKASVASAAVTRKRKVTKKKVRYRTVKRCTYWNTESLLLEKAKKCGTSGGKWFAADVADIPTAFSYAFAMKLPSGKYVLEVQARDADGHPEITEKGRNVLTFTVR